MATLTDEGGNTLNDEGGNPLYDESLYTFAATTGQTATVHVAGRAPTIALVVAKVKGAQVSTTLL